MVTSESKSHVSSIDEKGTDLSNGDTRVLHHHTAIVEYDQNDDISYLSE